MRALGAVALAAATILGPGGTAVQNAHAAPDAGERTRIEWRLADPADFRPGLLISDDRFYDSAAMDAASVQRFLERTACHPDPGVPCLADYRETTPDVPAAGARHCGRYEGARRQRASSILTQVAKACGINPQVLLVLLQKEQSLLTRPSASGYERATGYACPDTADCDAKYFGLFHQLYAAAWQFRQYTLFPGGRGFEIGRVRVAYSPEARCGSGAVRIRNQATANLYVYTPYQPDAAALASLYGDGDECSSYGNRNFWRIFTDWFGDPAAVRFPPWLGPCVAHQSGRPCLDAYWPAPPPR